MKRGCCSVLLLVSLGVLAAPVSGAAPGGGAGTVSAKDARLNAPVTLREVNEPLNGALGRLARDGRIRLEVRPESEWEPVTLYVKDRPMGEVMNGIASLLNLNWTAPPTSQAEPRYRLSKGIRARDAEAALWGALLERAGEPLFKLPTYLGTPYQEYDQMMDRRDEIKDPVLKPNVYYLARPRTRAAIALLGTLTSDQRTRLLREERLVLRWGEMTPEQREPAKVMAWDAANDRHPPFEVGEPDAKTMEWLDRVGLVLTAPVRPGTGAVESYGYGLGGVNVAAGSFDEDAPGMDLLPVRGNPYVRRTGTTPPVYPELKDQPFPAAFKPEGGKPQPWSRALGELSKHLALPIYSDGAMEAEAPLDLGERLTGLVGKKLPEALDAMSSAYHRLWWYDKGALYFRTRTWFVDQEYRVPPPVLAEIREQLAANGRLDGHGLDLLSGLTARQLAGMNRATALKTGGLESAGGDPSRWAYREGRGSAQSAYAHLQAYRALDAGRKARVLSPEGVTFDAMTPEQQGAYITWIGPEYGPGMLDAPDKLVFRVSQKTGESGRADRRAVDVLLRWREDDPGRAPYQERLSISYPAPKGGVREPGSGGVTADAAGGGGDAVRTVKR